MRMKLVLLAGASLLLAGCAAGEPAPEPTPSETAVETEPYAGLTFCETFDAERDAYQDTLDSDEPLTTDALDPYRSWGDALKELSDDTTAGDVGTFTSPLYATEDTTVSAIDVFMAGNTLGQYCLTNG